MVANKHDQAGALLLAWTIDILKNKIIPNGDEYREGHKIGVTQYCTQENGYILGEMGKAFPIVCAGNHWVKEGYQKGREKFLRGPGKTEAY